MADVRDESIDIEPRPGDEVVRRVAVLVALVRRAVLEVSDEGADQDDGYMRETDRFDLYSWTRWELAGDMMEVERPLLGAPVGGLDEAEIEACLASIGPARALAWCLGAVDSLSPTDAPDAHADTLVGWAPKPWDEIRRWGRHLSLRSEDMLAEERERWELWHWRATVSEDDLEPGENLADVVGAVARDAGEAGLVGAARADFAIGGKSFGALGGDEQEAVAVLAEGYLHALNWVCGFGDTWDTSPLYPD